MVLRGGAGTHLHRRRLAPCSLDASPRPPRRSPASSSRRSCRAPRGRSSTATCGGTSGPARRCCERGRVPNVDTWSIVGAGRPWVSQDWLANVLLAAGNSLGPWGETALSLLFGLIAVASLLGALARHRAARAADRVGQPHRVALDRPCAGGPGDGGPGAGARPADGHDRDLDLLALHGRSSAPMAGGPAAGRRALGEPARRVGAPLPASAEPCWWARPWIGSCGAARRSLAPGLAPAARPGPRDPARRGGAGRQPERPRPVRIPARTRWASPRWADT